ncbi:MAG TPA: hypothetical protein VER17_04660 [Tepidisphaeraceae bacterium]|nr:hypothetical protein [Tepidisphaeraceae bacterium]
MRLNSSPRSVLLALLAAPSLVVAGCAADFGAPRSAKPAAVEPSHPRVVIQGIDGTVLAGELLNGSITLESGQGELTLLTDHVHSLTLSQDGDKLDSQSVKVSGKVKDQRFFLRNEHGVISLAKDRLRKIEFVGNPGSAPLSHTTVKAAAAPMR